MSHKTRHEIHRELMESSLFKENTQKLIAKAVGVDQATISRIASGNFKRVNKSVQKVCKYAGIKIFSSKDAAQLQGWLSSQAVTLDHDKKKLVEIIGLAVDLLQRS